ncbi:MAG: DUF2029 domain-containing protein [Lachnospiraceae bacterium]|nr:DUF2029 domain-containing protein [Lachnospiraceae bacterium]
MLDSAIERILSDDRIKRIILTVFLLLAALSLFQGCKNAVMVSQDFQWDAAKAFTLRINPYDESLSPGGVLEKYGFEKYYLQMEANQFPSLLMLLIPFTFLPPLAARYVWLFCNLLFTAGIIILLRRTFLRDTDDFLFWFSVLFMISGTPYRNQLGVGQHTLFAFFFFLLAVYCLDMKGKKGFIAVTLSLFVCYFKYTLTVPLALWFVYKKRYKEIIASVILHGVLTVFAAFWLKDSLINMILKPLKVSSALSSEGGIDLPAMLNGSPAAYVLSLMILLLLLVYAVKVTGYPDNEGLLISLLTLWSLVTVYHRTYDFFVLIILTVLFSVDFEHKRKILCFYAVLMIYINYVLRIFSENPASRAGAALLYYTFAVTISAAAVRKLTKNGQKS